MVRRLVGSLPPQCREMGQLTENRADRTLVRRTILWLDGRPDSALSGPDITSMREKMPDQSIVLEATRLINAGSFQAATALLDEAIANGKDSPDLWVVYGDGLKVLGDISGADTAYREGLKKFPCSGELWWSISNLKTTFFDQLDVNRLCKCLESMIPNDKNAAFMRFAAGRALEDNGRYREAFENYVIGNAIHRRTVSYNGAQLVGLCGGIKRAFTTEFLGSKPDAGSDWRTPIFVVGMPRSGSTLIEQILSAHSMIEGAGELPHMLTVRRGLSQYLWKNKGGVYPDDISLVPDDIIVRSAYRYLKLSSNRTIADKKYFIDKTPANWIESALIFLLFHKSKIINIHRNPMDCIVSNFKQHYFTGGGFSYSIKSMLHYYRTYADMMSHLEMNFPDRIRSVKYEGLVADLRGEIQKLSEFLEVEFEPECLRFHQNDRPIYTPSSGQVRMPINADGIGAWRRFEPWLGNLKDLVLSEIPGQYLAE